MRAHSSLEGHPIMAHSHDPAPNRRRREVKLAADIRGCAIVEVVQFEDASVENAKSTQEFGGGQSIGRELGQISAGLQCILRGPLSPRSLVRVSPHHPTEELVPNHPIEPG